MYSITARIDHLSEGVGCFDPIQVFYRLRRAFPEVSENKRDVLWETCDLLRKLPDSANALQIAGRDFHERGPKILFEIPLANGEVVRGTAERYWITVGSEKELPDSFRSRFISFLETLFLQTIEIISEEPEDEAL